MAGNKSKIWLGDDGEFIAQPQPKSKRTLMKHNWPLIVMIVPLFFSLVYYLISRIVNVPSAVPDFDHQIQYGWLVAFYDAPLSIFILITIVALACGVSILLNRQALFANKLLNAVIVVAFSLFSYGLCFIGMPAQSLRHQQTVAFGNHTYHLATWGKTQGVHDDYIVFECNASDVVCAPILDGKNDHQVGKLLVDDSDSVSILYLKVGSSETHIIAQW